jgi:ABC-type Fe3+ transport system substrate-binding protein
LRARRLLPIATLFACMIATGTALPQASAPPRDPAGIAELVKAAAQDGTLDVAWGNIYGGGDAIGRISDGITKKYGVKLKINYSPVANGASYLASIMQEVRAGQTASSDVMFTLADATQVKNTQAVDYRRYVPGLPADVMFYDRHSVVAVSILIAEEYNTNLVPRAKVPTRLRDLLDPAFKGKIATSPYQGSQGAYLGLPEMLGHAGMTAFYKSLSDQLSGLTTCGETDRVVSGEFWFFGLDCGDQEVRLRQRKGEPIGLIYPKEGTAIRAFAPAIPLTAAHPYAARLFITFLLTPEGQNILWDVMGTDNYRLPGSHIAKIIADQRRRGVKFINEYGLDVQHPEIDTYISEINKIVNTSR